MSPESLDAYTELGTRRCERVLVTLLGSLGPWAGRVRLVGGLVPRYLIGRLPEGAPPHVGSTDVDLVVSLAIVDEDDAYRTLERNMRQAGFIPGDSSFQWRRDVDGVAVLVEYLCETDEVPPGKIHKTKAGTGTKFGAFNVEGAELTTRDFIEVEVEAERLDGGGLSRVVVLVANLLPFLVLKIRAFQDRHVDKDAYDLVFCLRNWADGPEAAGRYAVRSPVRDDPIVASSVLLLEERFADPGHDGPTAYANFLLPTGIAPDAAYDRNRAEAAEVVRLFLRGFRAGAGEG